MRLIPRDDAEAALVDRAFALGLHAGANAGVSGTEAAAHAAADAMLKTANVILSAQKSKFKTAS